VQTASMPPLIRPGTLDDLTGVLPLIDKTAHFHEQLDPDRFGLKPDVAESYRGWLTRMSDDAANALVVAEVDGRIVGFALGAMQTDARIYSVGPVGFIHDLWVEEGQRRAGIGRQLVVAAIEHFRQHGAEQVRLDSAFANEPAQRLFANVGFRPAVVEMLLAI
jgi:ribosomal protein S18 acetylase RimI-like enzyme